MTAHKALALDLYRQLLRNGYRMAGYNFRQYAIRRTRDGFHANRNLTDKGEIESAIKYAEKELGVLKRQSVISQMYAGEPLVVEQADKNLAKKSEQLHSVV
ncbi:LYR motif-containing protein 4 [Yarrowia sp. C11]|nr:LYR motif-containing protein 4 [Yarrowia sp. E02]KAG5369415.1 LYR motif-containing protein 4 [Yarrowia sp. C11]